MEVVKVHCKGTKETGRKLRTYLQMNLNNIKAQAASSSIHSGASQYSPIRTPHYCQDPQA